MAFIVLLLSFIRYWSSLIHAACGRCDTISGILFQHWSFLLFMSSWGIHCSPSSVYPLLTPKRFLSFVLFWCFYHSLCFPNPIVVVITSNSRENWMWLLARLHHSIYGYSNQRGRNPDVGIVLTNYFPSVLIILCI